MRYNHIVRASFLKEHHLGQCADVSIVSEPRNRALGNAKPFENMNRIERLRELREIQKNKMKEMMYGVEDLDGAVVILVGLDLGRLCPLRRV